MTNSNSESGEKVINAPGLIPLLSKVLLPYFNIPNCLSSLSLDRYDLFDIGAAKQ